MLGSEIGQTKSDAGKQGQFFCGTSGTDREDIRVPENRFRQMELRHHCTGADRIWACAQRTLVTPPQFVWQNNDDINFLFFSSGRPLIDAVASAPIR